jgi:hypothetical protein
MTLFYFIYLLLILLIVYIPNLSNNNKVRLSILIDNSISKLFILLFLLFVLLEDYTIGILGLILYHTILIHKIDSKEGFQNYFN